MDELLRFLDLCATELGGVEAKLEVGGNDPEDERVVWAKTDAGFRLLVTFDAVPADRSGKVTRLSALADSFGEVERVALRALPSSHLSPARRELGELLAEVASLAGAERAVVFDDASPVVFGDSHDRVRPLDVGDAIFAARSITRMKMSAVELAEVLDALDTTDPSISDAAALAQLEAVTRPPPGASRAGQLRLCLAIQAVRDAEAETRRVREGAAPHLSRPFATVYRAVLVFAESFSEIRADGHLVRALSAIEKKTLSLPPLDPKGGARVRRLRPT